MKKNPGNPDEPPDEIEITPAQMRAYAAATPDASQ